MSFKEVIKSWRWRIRKSGFSQRSIANNAGIHEVRLSNLVNCKATPTLDEYEKIENIVKELGV